MTVESCTHIRKCKYYLRALKLTRNVDFSLFLLYTSIIRIHSFIQLCIMKKSQKQNPLRYQLQTKTVGTGGCSESIEQLHILCALMHVLLCRKTLRLTSNNYILSIIYYQQAQLQGKMIQFEFPSSVIDFQEFQSVEQLKSALTAAKDAFETPSALVSYRVVQHKGKYVYAKCSVRGCTAGLKYKLEGITFRLRFSKLKHIHHAHSSKSHKYRAIEEYISSFPKNASLINLKHAICRSFGISDKQYYYLLKRCTRQHLSFLEYTTELERNGYQVYTSNEIRQPDTRPRSLVVVSPEMKRKFLLYGQRISFDLTFKLIKSQPSSPHEWKIGMFLGLSSTNHIVPLGIVIMTELTRQAYAQIFRMFFAAVGGQPKLIISDQQRAIHASIMDLQLSRQFCGHHLYDAYHILHNIFKKLKKKADIKYYAKMIHAKNKAQFEKYLRSAELQLDPNEHRILTHFLDNRHLYCFSAIQPHFVGFSSSTSINQSLHSFIKKMQPVEKDYMTTLHNLLNCTAVLLQKCEQFSFEPFPYEQTFKIEQLRALKLCLSKPIFSKIIEELAECLNLHIIERGQRQILVKQYNTFFTVSNPLGYWQCNCNYIQKAALPCRHLLRVIIYKESSIIDHLPDRWRAKQPDQVDLQIARKVGRSKTTKRKIM